MAQKFKPLVQSLPGIVFIGSVDCTKLMPYVREFFAADMPVPVLTEITAITVCDGATAEVVSERFKGALVQTATLKFRTPQYLDVDAQLGFVVTFANGRSALVGAAEQPFPSVKMTRRSGTPSGEAAVWEVEVKFTGERSLVECIF